MNLSEDTKQAQPSPLDLPKQAGRNVANVVGQSPVLPSESALKLPKMKPRRFTDPAIGSPDRDSFKGDPVLLDAASAGVSPPQSVFRSDGAMTSLIGERVNGELIPPQIAIPPSQEDPVINNDGPVIDSRYQEIDDPRLNALGIRRMVDHGSVHPNHKGIFTNLDDAAFNAEMNGYDNTESGGSFGVVPAAQMNAQVGGRRITGQLPSGGTYTYHLKQGQFTPQEQVNSRVIRPQATGNRQQDSLNSAGAAIANSRRDQRAQADERFQLRHAAQFEAQQRARRIQIENDLVEFFRESDPDIARSLLLATRDQGIIPKSPWKTYTTKQYDDLGNPISESTKFYRSGENSPELYDPSQGGQQTQSSQPEVPYEEAIKAIRAGLKKKPEVRERAIQKLMTDYGTRFNVQDLD